MSSELVPRSEEIGVAKLGDIFVKSGFFRDTRDQAQAVVKILYGRELGFSPVVSMMGIHVIEGKPSLSSNLMGTLVKRSGRYDYRVKESTDKRCSIEFLQKDGKKWVSIGESVFTIEDAQRAGVVRAGGGWSKYPKAMLFARALSAGVKQHCPDVSACPLYVPEELGATVDEEGGVVEMPASARPVAVTTEPIPISRNPANEAAQETKSTVKGGATPEKIADQPQEVVMSGETAAASTREPGSDDEVELIGLGEQRSIHREFREALAPHLQKDAEGLLASWLATEDFIDDNNRPTTKLIEKALFAEVKAKAVAWAKQRK